MAKPCTLHNFVVTYYNTTYDMAASTTADTSMISTKENIIIITLICLCITVSTLLIVALNFSRKVFILLFCAYIVATSAFTFALYVIYRKQHTNDFKYMIATYMSLFNMIFSLTLFFIGMFILIKERKNEGSHYSYGSSSSSSWPRY